MSTTTRFATSFARSLTVRSLTRSLATSFARSLAISFARSLAMRFATFPFYGNHFCGTLQPGLTFRFCLFSCTVCPHCH